MRQTQNKQILQYLQSGKKITTYVSFVKFRITNLPKRISELRSEGYEINKEWKKTGKTQVMEYYL